MRSGIALLLGVAFVAAPAGGPAQAAPALPSYNADPAQTSVSGISSGAYMAVQFGIAWSSIIKGVGAVAGGPFGCAQGSAATALSTCMAGAPPPDLADFIRRADTWSSRRAIDGLDNIAAQKIYLFSGYNDQVVARPVADALHDFYLHYLGAHAANLFYQTAIGAGHAQVTLNYGGGCRDNGGEYINKCGYDQAGIILQHIYGALNARNGGALSGQFLWFAQQDFTAPDQPIDDSMADQGAVYVPASCSNKEPCRLHVALHGCQQSVQMIGEDFIRHAGYNEWADTNHIIVLYPQTQSTVLVNPEGCWDWWGYLDADAMDAPDYLLKSGRQIRAIKAMVDRLAGGAPTPAAAAPPATLLAIDRSDTAIDLAWSGPAASAGYDVFRASGDSQDFTQIGTVPGLSFADSGLQPATAYRYKVRASAASAEAFSPIATQTTLPLVPPCAEPGACPLR